MFDLSVHLSWKNILKDVQYTCVLITRKTITYQSYHIPLGITFDKQKQIRKVHWCYAVKIARLKIILQYNNALLTILFQK